MGTENENKTLDDYLEARIKYEDMLMEYFTVFRVDKSERPVVKTLTATASKKLDWLANDVEKKRKIWMEYLNQKHYWHQ